MHVSKRCHNYSISRWPSALLLKGGWWCPPQWVLGDWPPWGVPTGQSPYWGSHCVHVGNPGGFILDYAGSVHHCHHGFHQHIWLHYLWGCFNGNQQGWFPQQAGCNSLEAQGKCNFWHRFWRPWWWHRIWLFLQGLSAFFHSLTWGSPFPLHSGCGAFVSTHQEPEEFVWQRLPTGWDALPPSSQGNHYGKLLPFPSPHATQGEYLALLLAHWWWLLGWLVPQQAPLWGCLFGSNLFWVCLFGRNLCRGCLFSGLFCGAAPSVGTLAGGSSLVGSLAGPAGSSWE